MFGGYKKIFFLSISVCYAVCYAFPSTAQFIDDIPLFGEVETSPNSSDDKGASTLVTAPKEEDKKPEQKKPEPNIGRRGIPLDRLIITPDPIPEVSIPLRSDPPAPVETISPKPIINTRQEGIYIPPADKTEAKPAQPSNFVSLHDPRQFEIEGFYLGMTSKALLQIAKQKGYWISKVKKAIPLFQTTHYDTLCRQSGIRAPEMVRACIRQHAQKNKQDYVEEILLTKKSTHESFQFLLTSPATDNEVYQITYRNRGDNSLNFTRQNLAKKLDRKEAFFNAVFEMYGYPDDKEELIWGSKSDAYMQVSMGGSAYDATIKMVDVELSDEDYFEATDWKADQESPHHFSFVE